jgi:iron complex outermembrane receptor protein
VAIPLRFLLLFFGGLLLISTPLTGQWTFSGRIVDAETGEGLSYVNIVFKNHPALNTTSDQAGDFQIVGLTETQYTVDIIMIGFKSVHFENLTSTTFPKAIALQPETYLTDEIVISASRKSQHLHLAPASVNLITQKQIQQQGTSSLDESLAGLNGVLATRSSNSNTQSISIRGASEVAGGGIGNRVLLLLDGRPAITPESGGALWNLVPLNAVERIEVIKGAYSSLFGSSAMGGIVNIITREPDTSTTTTLGVQYGFYDTPPAYVNYSGHRAFTNVNAVFSNKLNKWSYVFAGNARHDDGHRQKTSFDQYNGFGKFTYHFSPNRTMKLSAMYSDINNDTPASWITFTKPYHVAEHRHDDRQRRREWNADLYYEAFAHAHVKYSTRFYYYGAFSDFLFNADPDNDSTNVNIGKQFVDDEFVKVHRFGNTSQVDISIGRNHYMIGGIDIQSDYINGQPDTVLYGIHRAFNIGAYVQDEITLDRLIITGGLRYDFYRITGTYMEANVSPKLAAVFQVNDNIAIRSLLARAFRNPSISERYTKFEQGGGLRFTVNPQLRAEKLTLSAELGSNIEVSKQLSFDVALYYNRYKDLIYYQQRSIPGESLLFEVLNLNSAIMQGFEVSAQYIPFKNLSLAAGYNFLDARDQSSGRVNDILPYKSKHTTFFSANYQWKDFQFSFNARSRSRIDEVFIFSGSEPDGYLLMNGKITYKPSASWSVFIKVDNLTDQQYEEIERYRLAGRSYATGISISF